MTPADRFASAVATALELPTPADIWRTILATADDGLRAANYDAKVRGGDPLTHPEREADKRIAGKVHDDQAEGNILHRAGGRFIDAIAALNAVCSDAGAPDTWQEACQDAHLLAETGVLAAAVDVGWDVVRWVNQACDAVRDVRGVHERHTPRVASQYEAAWTSGLADEDCCTTHLAVHISLRVPRTIGDLCDDCDRLRHMSLGVKPPDWVVEVYARTGGGPEWRRTLSRWLDELGVSRDRAC